MSMGEAPVTPAQQRSLRRAEMRRDQLCDVAARLFAEHGYQNTTLGMIAEEMGYTKTNLYHYVESKEEVYATLLERFLRQIREEVVAATPNTLPVLDRLRKAVAVHVTSLCSRPDGKVLMANVSILQQRLQEFPSLVEASEAYEQVVRGILHAGIEAGVFRYTNLTMASLSVFSILNSMSRWYSPQGPLTPEEIAQELAEFILRGVNAT